eukprot:g23467.t1
MVAITKEKVLEKLKYLKMDKSPGPDGLHPRVLKEIVEEIAEALVVIFQKEVRQKTGNYRLISLTSVIGKILESIVKDEISEYLEVH